LSTIRTTPSTTTAMSIEVVIGRLKKHPAVDAIILHGSAAEGIGPGKDYDLVVFLSRVYAPIRHIVTTIDNRLADVVPTSSSILDRIAEGKGPTRSNYWDGGGLTRWLAEGTNMFDRRGALASAQKVIQKQRTPAAPTEQQIHSGWFSLHYELLHIRRRLESSDEIALVQADFRLAYAIDQTHRNYFLTRQLPWRGSKGALEYLRRSDPKYYALLIECLNERNRRSRLELLEQLAEVALEPLGASWAPNETSVEFETGANVNAELIGECVRLWGELTSVH
jgi:hypothetical protein